MVRRYAQGEPCVDCGQQRANAECSREPTLVGHVAAGRFPRFQDGHRDLRANAAEQRPVTAAMIGNPLTNGALEVVLAPGNCRCTFGRTGSTLVSWNAKPPTLPEYGERALPVRPIRGFLHRCMLSRTAHSESGWDGDAGDFVRSKCSDIPASVTRVGCFSALTSKVA